MVKALTFRVLLAGLGLLLNSEVRGAAGFEESAPPRFQERATNRLERPRVSIETSLGAIEVELEAKAAPVTVTNFLRTIRAGLYQGGHFHRTVTLSNQPANSVKIEVIQASANPAKTNELLAPIPLERTRDTGLKHRDGAISMARLEPDSARDHFFICIGDQPELDFAGKRNPDGQGYAAFGKVIKGMEVARKIHTSPAEGQTLTPPIAIREIKILPSQVGEE